MRAAFDEAREHSMKVWAHVGAVTFRQAIDMGVDQLFHGALVMPDGRKPGTTTQDFAQWTKGTGQLDLTAHDVQSMLRAAARRRVVLTPTAVVEEAAWVGDRE